MKLKIIINFTKTAKKKKQNQNNDQIEKYSTINLNWRIKMKTTKTFTKRPSKKIKNPNNEDDIEEYNIWWTEIEW